MSKNYYQVYDTENKAKKGQLHIAHSVITELLLMAGVLGVLFCFISDSTGQMILLSAMLVSIVYLNLIGRIKPELEILQILPAAVGVIALLFNPIGASRGFLYFCNQCIQLLDLRFNQLVPQLQVSGASVFNRMQFLLGILLIIGVWLHKQVNSKHLFSISCAVLLLLLLTAVFQMSMGSLWSMCMVSGWILAWLTTVSIHFWSTKQIPIGVGGLCLMALLSGLFSHYTGSLTVENAQSDFLAKVEKTRYGSDTLPEGDMVTAENMVGSSEEAALQLTTDTVKEMYLKGFVGGNFDGTKWSMLQYADYTDEEIALMQWLEDQSFESSYAFGQYMTYTGEAEGTTTSSVKLENVGANRRYVYLPYETTSLISGRGSMYRDYQVKAFGVFGTDTYEIRMLDVSQPTETFVQKQFNTSIAGASEYMQQENVYASYVQSNYLTLTDAQKTELEQFFFAEGDWSMASLYEVTDQIRTVLQEETVYADQPQSYNGNGDFVDWFINTAKGGNSAYYATVAALAYRAAGIPARYVEGYYLSDSVATQYQEAGETEVTLSQADAHAWTEVYVDQVGWMPVEVVPGFYYAEYTTQQIVGAPQSTVSITNQTDQQKFQGTTVDELQGSSDQKNEDTPVVEQIIHVVGILLLIALIIWLLQFIIMVRYRIMRSVYEGKLNKANYQDASRMRYSHVCKVLKSAGLPVKEDFPYENIALIQEACSDVELYECKRFVQLLQKIVFGQQELNDAEYQTVQIFDEKVTEQVYEKQDRKGQLVMKLGRALI